MCSIVEAPTRSTGSRLAALVGHFGELGAEVAAMLADPEMAAEIAGLPGDALAGFVTSLASTVDAGTAAMTVVTGHVDAGGGRGGVPDRREVRVDVAVPAGRGPDVETDRVRDDRPRP
jgi:hypothetical protein